MRSLSVILFAAAEALRFGEQAALVSTELLAEPKKNRPVTKVINLLKDMQKQLEAEAETDEEVYDKMKCWCKTNDGEKSKAIKEAEVKIQNLQASIEKNTAKVAQMDQEIKNHDSEMKEEQQSLATATKLREKEAAEFNQKNKEVVQAISSLKSALTVLGKHQKNSSGKMNVASPVLVQTSELVDSLFTKFGDSILAGISQHEHKAVSAFLQGGNVNDYASQSGQIFGILQNMLDTFIADNKEALDAEAAAVKAFTEFKAQKEESIALLQKQIDEKTDIKAQAEAQKAQDKQDMEDTRNNLGEDEKFLAMLKEKCAQTDEEWAARTKERANEQAAVAKALEFLTSDEAHDLFSSTFNPSFVQKTSSSNSRRQRAAKVLGRFPNLSMLSAQVKLDAFTKVKAAIDEMVKNLKEQKDNEIKTRDSCVARFQENDMNTQKQNQHKADHSAAQEKLEQDISNLEKEIKQKKETIDQALKDIKEAGENRAKENAEFQQTIAEQRASTQLLEKAKSVLGAFYEKDKAFMQKSAAGQPAGPPPPAGFTKYEKSSGGNSVITMITQIINDAKALEAEAIRDEREQQKNYEEEVQANNELVDKLRSAIANHEQNKATAQADLVETKQALADAVQQLEALGLENNALHEECDFLMKNFDVRQEAFDQEMEALRQAKAILSGSDAGAF